MAVADHGGDTGQCGEFFRGALGIATGSDDAAVGVLAMGAANVCAGLPISLGGNAAGIHDDHIGFSREALGGS